MAVQLSRRLFTVPEYHWMAEAGILGEDDRVELLDGEIVAISPIGSRRAGCVNRLTNGLVGRLGGKAIVHVQNPVCLDEHSEGQPDLALWKPRPDFFMLGPTRGRRI